jgi:putative metallohydrolase (TIGR04338 family)
VNNERRSTYEAEDAADLKTRAVVSDAARLYLSTPGRIPPASCQHYIGYVLAQPWFIAAFPNQVDPVTVVGGARTRSSASEVRREITAAIYHRDNGIVECERMLLHELAHIVTRVPPIPWRTGLRRSGESGEGAAHKHYRVTNAHTHAYRVNHVRIVRGMLGDQVAYLLRQAYDRAGVVTHK